MCALQKTGVKSLPVPNSTLEKNHEKQHYYFLTRIFFLPTDNTLAANTSHFLMLLSQKLSVRGTLRCKILMESREQSKSFPLSLMPSLSSGVKEQNKPVIKMAYFYEISRGRWGYLVKSFSCTLEKITFPATHTHTDANRMSFFLLL